MIDEYSCVEQSRNWRMNTSTRGFVGAPSAYQLNWQDGLHHRQRRILMGKPTSVVVPAELDADLYIAEHHIDVDWALRFAKKANSDPM